MTELGTYIEGEEIEIQDEAAANEKLRQYGLMFSKLMESQRFRELVSLYFTFTKVVNHETKEIDFQVIENPPEVIAKKMQAVQMKEEESIQIVSGSRAQAILDAAKKSAEQGGRRRDAKRR